MSNTTPSTLYTALLAAQRAMGPVKKDASNPAFRSKYATLQSVLETVEQPLWDNGLVLVQRFGADENGLTVLVTEIIHAESGATLQSAVPVVGKDPTDPQKMGSAITYYRRYSLLALLGLAPEDDDANTARVPSGQPAPPRQQQRESDEAILRRARTNDESLSVAEYARVDALTAQRQAQPKPDALDNFDPRRPQDRKPSAPAAPKFSPGPQVVALGAPAPLDTDGMRLYPGNGAARTSAPAPAPPPLLDTIRDDRADPKLREKALHNYMMSATTLAQLAECVTQVSESGMPEATRDKARAWHTERITTGKAPAPKAPALPVSHAG